MFCIHVISGLFVNTVCKKPLGMGSLLPMDLI